MNPIPKTDMWTTPNSLDELFQQLDRFSGQEKALVMHGAMLALNLAHMLHEKSLADVA